MDKNLHNDIGDLFRDKIEPLNQPPREEVWQNLEQQLDKTETSIYRNKFINARRMSAILFLLFIGFVTATFFYIRTTKTDITKVKIYNGSQSENLSNNVSAANSDNAAAIAPPFNNKKSYKININSKNKLSNFVKNNSFKNKDDAFKKPLLINRHKELLKIENAKAEEDLYSPDTNASLSTPTVIAKELTTTKTGLEIQPVLQSAIINKIQPLSSVINSSVAKNKKKNNSAAPYSMTLFAAPEFAGYYLENDEVTPHADKMIIEQRENHLLSSSAGVLISRKINKHLSIQSGLIYSSSNISIDPTKIYAVKDDVGNIKYRYNTSAGFGYFLPSFSSSPIVGDSLYTRTSTHNLQFISLPLMIKYSSEKKKFSFNPALGISFNFLTKAKLKTEIENSLNKEIETITKLEGTQKVGFSLLIIPEVQYKISNKWAISATPYFKYALTPITKAYVVRTFPLNLGLGIGLGYRF